LTADVGKAEAVTREIRACFNRLRALGDALHGDLGVTAAMRAVMEALHDGGEQTVSGIARAKSVSRQHIQVLTNGLIDVGLVKTRANPADKRSPLVALTAKGKRTFATMRRREKAVLDDLSHALGANDVEATMKTLKDLHAYLDNQLEKGTSDD
jgi:DNA-binding MarR family transcriptional regulator